MFQGQISGLGSMMSRSSPSLKVDEQCAALVSKSKKGLTGFYKLHFQLPIHLLILQLGLKVSY